MRARLTVESGIALPRVCELDDEAVVHLGRNKDNTIVLQDRHASRWHARVYASNGLWYICDLETTNGTCVNGAPAQQDKPLTDGQVVAIGDTRLRFNIEPDVHADLQTLTPTEGVHGLRAAAGERPDSGDVTILEADELTALFRFMNDSLGVTTPNELVRLALQAVVQHTGADLAGFLSLDADNPELKVVLPTQAAVDPQLSHHLTQQVLREGRSVWLSCPPRAGSPQSDSLSNFKDAVCVPLHAPLAGIDPGLPAEAPLGALHVYRAHRPFSEREVRFCEVLAGALANTLHALRGRRALEADNTRLRVHGSARGDEIIGSSAAMRGLRQQVYRLAECPLTVLIIGESGVGKELVALGLHRQGPRPAGPLVAVNCASLTASMPESELFGHVKGAFTGATRDHPGFFLEADTGTLFLDEIGELALDIQAKLLRAIETKFIRPVGGRDLKADVRIIAATNRDLQQEVRVGRFRKDLFYRLTSRIDVPPLREHREDIPELVKQFLEHLAEEYHRRVSLSEVALQRLMAYSWPGNVRQLRGVLAAAVGNAADGGVIQASDLQVSGDLEVEGSDRPNSLNLKELETWAIEQALERTGGNKTQAALLLGINRDTLLEKVKRYGLERRD
jgi:Nif-specific regulatory protein